MSTCICGRELRQGEASCPLCGRRAQAWPPWTSSDAGHAMARVGGARPGSGEPQPPAGRASSGRALAVAASVAAVVALAGIAAVAVAAHLAATNDATRARYRPPPISASSAPLAPVPLERLATAALTRVVTVEALDVGGQLGFGTAWLFDTQADFVTNEHVVAGQRALRLLDRSGRMHVGILVGSDASADIAIVHSQDGFTGDPLPLDPAENGALPEPVAVLASSRATGHGDVTSESLVARHRSVTIQPEEEGLGAGASPIQDDDMLLLGGSLVYHGNSGGPVLDSAGRVIGIVTAASKSSPSAYAIPLGRVLDELRRLAAGRAG